jgi:CheY-like chemotaxis protein
MEQPKILIIDDNTDFLFTTETLLQRNGFDTLTAEDGRKGLDLVKKEKPDLILLDIMMETLLSGFEVCRQMKSDPALKDIPIIGVSGMGEEIGVHFDKDRDAEYFQPDNFFEKPVDREKLLAKINELINK